MTKKTPQKRAAELVCLSHEHHHALVFCVRLKKAPKVSVEIIQNYVRYFWENHILLHFENEEKYLLDLIPNIKHQEQFLLEHNQIKQLVNQILINAETSINNALMLSEILNNHIRFEERELFPEIEKWATQSQLQAVASFLNKDVACPVFLPEFWKNNS